MWTRSDYVQLEMHDDITSISYGHSPDPTHRVHSSFFGADGADVAKLHPEVDANGNCAAVEKVSPLCLVFRCAVRT